MEKIEKGFSVDGFGTQRWRVNGKLHRKHAPALIDAEGCQVWYWRGKVHREDGPAKTYPDGSQEWWIANEQLSEDGFHAYLLNRKLVSSLSVRAKIKEIKI